jgi:hypothetical protein
VAGPAEHETSGDAYVELLGSTRGLRKEQAQAREAWLARLPIPRKEHVLFELEILLKGLACFANPRNHPGPPRRAPVVSVDFREHLVLVRESLGRIVALCRSLLVEKDRAFVFQRYLETVLPDDGARTKLVGEAMTQDSPQGSLFVLRHAMTNLLEVTTGITRLQRVPYRLFYAVLGVAQREIAQSAFFNPLTALEFRPEFDRITNPQMLELMHSVPEQRARHLVALTSLSLFRMLRYLTLLDDIAQGDKENGRRAMGLVLLVASVLRSDARALTAYLRRRAGPLLAESFELDVLSVAAPDLPASYQRFLAEGHRLMSVKATLEGIAANVRLEMRRALDHEFPGAGDAPAPQVLRAAVQRTTQSLRPALQNAVLFLARSLGARLDARGVFDDDAARRVLSERLRRDVWMFGRIVRAFSDKARAATAGEDRWAGVSPLQFVREFMAYFRSMGYPLLRVADYPRVDAFLAAMARLEDGDLLEPSRMRVAVDEAERFHAFLQDLFVAIGKRDELAGVPFDRRAAAESLKLYLGDAPAT